VCESGAYKGIGIRGSWADDWRGRGLYIGQITKGIPMERWLGIWEWMMNMNKFDGAKCESAKYTYDRKGQINIFRKIGI
jgi:hypothetical protein